jgi:DNA-binding response OmpR family regulator
MEDIASGSPQLETASTLAEPQEAKILIVEDDPDIARLIAHHLHRAGYQVRTTHSAEEALSELSHEIPDLITLDIELPGMQGDELAAQLHANPLTRDIPILILSIFGEDPTRMRFGAYVLPKPIDQDVLLARVASMLKEHHQASLLVIDDDADVLFLLKAALEKQGFIVQTAPNGEQGLAQAREHHPSLIMLDMHMPIMDGFAVLQALKASQETAEIPVIAMTGSPELKTNARARFLALGASDFITKPFDMHSLVEEIRIFITVKEENDDN